MPPFVFLSMMNSCFGCFARIDSNLLPGSGARVDQFGSAERGGDGSDTHIKVISKFALIA